VVSLQQLKAVRGHLLLGLMSTSMKGRREELLGQCAVDLRSLCGSGGAHGGLRKRANADGGAHTRGSGGISPGARGRSRSASASGAAAAGAGVGAAARKLSAGGRGAGAASAAAQAAKRSAAAGGGGGGGGGPDPQAADPLHFTGPIILNGVQQGVLSCVFQLGFPGTGPSSAYFRKKMQQAESEIPLIPGLNDGIGPRSKLST
jgi:hypothetical protein